MTPEVFLEVVKLVQRRDLREIRRWPPLRAMVLHGEEHLPWLCWRLGSQVLYNRLREKWPGDGNDVDEAIVMAKDVLPSMALGLIVFVIAQQFQEELAGRLFVCARVRRVRRRAVRVPP